MPKPSAEEQVRRDADREALRRGVVRRLWMLGYDEADIAARIIDSLDYKHLLKGYEHPVQAIRRDIDVIEAGLREKYPTLSWELIQYMERCRTVYQQGLLMADSLPSGQARASSLKVALEASEDLARVQQLPVEGIGKLKPSGKDKSEEDEEDKGGLPGLAVRIPKGTVTELGDEEAPKKKAKRRR